MRFPPLFIEIMLWYYTSPYDYREGDHSAPAVCEFIKRALDLQLIKKRIIPEEEGSQYEITERGAAWIKALCTTPLPCNCRCDI